MRVGGLDVLFMGLAGQTYRDFELVLVDGIAARIGMFNPDVPGFVHVKPKDGPHQFPIAAFCNYANTGLIHASGDIVLFVTDYTWLPPDTLAVHAKFHDLHPEKQAALMMPHEYRALPRLSAGFPTYRDEDTDRYARDVESGYLAGCYYSIFATHMAGDPRMWPLDLKWGGADPKNNHVPGPIDGNFFHAKNESVKLETVLDVNGWDEDLDGTHAFQDSVLSGRLSDLAGVQWTLSHACVAQIVNPRPVFPFAKRIYAWESNELIWQVKKARGFPPANDFDLRELRRETLADTLFKETE